MSDFHKYEEMKYKEHADLHRLVKRSGHRKRTVCFCNPGLQGEDVQKNVNSTEWIYR